MKKIIQSFPLNEKIKYPEIFSQYNKAGDKYLTIETTGLSPERHRIISLSTAAIAEDMIEVTTFFSDNRDDELTIIEKALDELEKVSRIITWNGDSFDFRFLIRRAAEYGKKVPDFPSFDLRKVLSPLRRFIKGSSFSLYELLDEMDITDSSIPDGKTLVTLYQTFIGTGEDRYSSPIEKHSIYKLNGIMNLMSLMNCLKINRATPEIDETSAASDSLRMQGKTDIFFPIELSLVMPGIDIKYSGTAFSGRFDIYDGRIRMYYPDPASYVRLISDGSLIPKELSKTLAKGDYEKVTKENCFSLVKIPHEKKQLENYIMSLEKM